MITLVVGIERGLDVPEVKISVRNNIIALQALLDNNGASDIRLDVDYPRIDIAPAVSYNFVVSPPTGASTHPAIVAILSRISTEEAGRIPVLVTDALLNMPDGGAGVTDGVSPPQTGGFVVTKGEPGRVPPTRKSGTGISSNDNLFAHEIGHVALYGGMINRHFGKKGHVMSAGGVSHGKVAVDAEYIACIRRLSVPVPPIVA